ncbi:hypothetical protein [Janthinobacterium agaricidamnosum]|uniref:hypothetical protein n=1 Tax=Janthinobacterium agaricidamnosum TaxID=55508 RepID=UPI0007743A4E|nr:hypothetical protein [Janthinobacterium agaricidamnosum]
MVNVAVVLAALTIFKTWPANSKRLTLSRLLPLTTILVLTGLFALVTLVTLEDVTTVLLVLETAPESDPPPPHADRLSRVKRVIRKRFFMTAILFCVAHWHERIIETKK